MSVTKKTKVNLKDISSVLKELSFELPIDRTLKEEEKVILDLSRKVKLKGFRPGKVPVNVIRGRFKKDVEEQIAETMVNSEVEGYLKESDLKPIAPSVSH